MGKVKMKMLAPRVKTLQTGTVKTFTTRAVRIAGSARQAINRRIMRRDNGLCQCDECKAAMAPRAADVVDHIVPLWEGGAESDANRQALSDHCHAIKTAAETRRRFGMR